MGFPPQYRPKFDLAQAIANGDIPSATELATELFNAAASINESISFIRSISTANQRVAPAQLNATTFVIEDEQTGSAAQTEILYQNSVTVDPLLATVGVFINGERLPPSDVTVASDRVTVTPALTGGEEILLEIHDNADSVFSKLGSISANLGASLVGIEDIDGLYASSNVEEALAEVKFALNTFVALVGDLSKYLRADVAIPWEVDQDAGGYKLTNGVEGTDPTDFVIFRQLSDIIEQFVDLGGRFLPIAGGVMNGTISMAGNAITALVATPTTAIGDPGYSSVARYAATKEYIDNIADSITGGGGALDGYLPLAGGTMSGALDMDGNEIQGIPTADASGEPVEYDQFTTAISGIGSVTAQSTTQVISNTSFDIGALPDNSILRAVIDFEDVDHTYVVEFTLFAIGSRWYPTGEVYEKSTDKVGGATEARCKNWDQEQVGVWRCDGDVGANFSLEFDFTSRDFACVLTTGQTGSAFLNVAYNGFSF